MPEHSAFRNGAYRAVLSVTLGEPRAERISFRFTHQPGTADDDAALSSASGLAPLISSHNMNAISPKKAG